jgi:ABC-type multidrug transport system fused ATPase/permease subunit
LRIDFQQNANKIVYVENGKVCEEGTHSELMQLQGKYFNIYEKIKQTSEIGINATGGEAAI